MKPFSKIYSGINIEAAQRELYENSHLFGEFNARKLSGPVHAQMDDIWLRYGDIKTMAQTGDYSKIAEEHDAIWLKDLPECKKICFEVMKLVDGERLGGVLITRLPPGGKILPHSDSGWHAEYYSKVYVPIENEEGAVFGFEHGYIKPNVGDAWMFDNSFSHWVMNFSKKDRIAMIICIKQSKYRENGQLHH